MKLLHKQLLAVCAPYLLLIIGVVAVHQLVVETMVAQRFRRDMKRDLNLHAGRLDLSMKRAQAEVRLLADSAAFRGGNLETIQIALRQLSPFAPFEAIYFDDLTGAVYSSNGKVAAGSRPPLPTGALNDQDFVSDFSFRKSSSPPVFYVVSPVKDEGDNVIGAVVGELSVTEALPELNLDEIAIGGNLCVEDLRGQRFCSPNGNGNAPNLLHWPSESRSVPPTNWYLRLTRNNGPVLRPARLLRDAILTASAFVMLISAGAVMWRHRSQSQRLASLTETIQRFGAADPTVRSLDVRSDELGRLAEAFNNMADDVVHAQRRLRKQLAEQPPAIANRQQAIEELEEKVAELERFNAAVAHDLKAPLVTLQGFAAGLEPAAKAGEWDRLRGDVARIQSAAGDLRGMIDGLLELDRLEQGSELRAEDVPLSQAVEDALALLQGQIRQSRITVNVAPGFPTVKGHRLRWRQVFQNLIDNAIKACHGVPSPRIDVGCERRGNELRCYVRDNGVGIDSGEQSRMFDLAQKGRGAGIGLALVKRIIERQGGAIRAESAGPGQGTTIWWTIAE